MIYITCGTCGTSQGYKNKNDGAITLPAAEERRLVARGVAEHVTKPVIGPDTGVATRRGTPRYFGWTAWSANTLKKWEL